MGASICNESKLDAFLTFLQKRLGTLDRYHYLGQWEFFQGETREIDEAAAPDFAPPGGWQPLPDEWDGNDGPAWVRTWVEFPEEIKGIPLAGTRAALEATVFLGATVYVDGKVALDAPYWTDMRGPQIILAEAVTPGERHLVVFRFRQRRGMVGMGDVWMNYARVEEVILNLGAFIHEIEFARRVDGSEEVLARVLALWGEKSGPESWDGLESFISEARQILFSLRNEVKKQIIHLIGHSHIDMNWMWPWEDTVDVVKRDFTTVSDLMDEFPDLTFSQSQAAVYKLTEKRFPEIFARMRKRIQERRWDVTASTWVEGDLNMASGEAIVRQILYAKKYAREHFGLEPRVCWEPDTFGHPATMPQILKKAGLDYYYFMRCAPGKRIFWWEGPDGSRVLAFSSIYNNEIRPERVSAISQELARHYGLKNSMFVYGVGDHGGGPTRDDIRRAHFMQKLPCLPELRFSRVEDFYDAVVAEKPVLPVVRGELNFTFDGCYTSHSEIKRWNRECENRLMDSEIFAALASWQAAGDAASRIDPNAGKMTCDQGAGCVHGESDAARGFVYPVKAFAEAWENTLFNQFHDILDGSAIEPSYEYSGQLAERALALAGAAGKDARAYLARKIVYAGRDGYPVVVFNSLPWARTEVVRARVPKSIMEMARSVRDARGNVGPIQIVGDEILFLAQDVPGTGYKTFFLTKETLPRITAAPADTEIQGIHETTAPCDASGRVEGDQELVAIEEQEKRGHGDSHKPGNILLQNVFFTLEIDRKTGTIHRLVDRSSGREVFRFKPTAPMGLEAEGEFLSPMPANLFQVLEEMPHPMSSWVLGPIRRQENLYTPEMLELGEKGPVMATARLKYRWRNSTIAQEICLYRGVRRIDFFTHLDWQEMGTAKKDAPMLKVSFTPRLGASKATYEIPFGWSERTADGRELPGQKWIDLSDGEYGVSLLNNAKYGFDVSGNTMRMTLVRSSYDPDPQPDTGVQDFTYSIYPHAGDWRQAETCRRAYEFNHPLIAEPLFRGGDEEVSISESQEVTVPETPSPEGISPGNEGPEGIGKKCAYLERSYLCVEPANVMVSALKQAEDGEDLILRIYEAAGQDTQAVITLNLPVEITRLCETDLMEREITSPPLRIGEDGKLCFPIRAWEIRTLRLKRAR